MAKASLRLALCCSESPGKIDGIRDYTLRLAAALRAIDDVTVDLHMRTPAGTWRTFRGGSDLQEESRSFPSGLNHYDAIVVQYNPFMYGRWGFAPWLPMGLWRLRISSSRVRVSLMVHEPYVPMVNWRWALMGIWQRCQLMTALWGTNLAFASIQAWAASVARLPLAPQTFHLPVGSNLPDARRVREAERARLQAHDNTLIVAVFSTGIPGRSVSRVTSAVNAIAQTGREVLLLNLGAGAHSVREGLSSRVQVFEPGRLPPSQLAANLATADLFLAPFVDGVSTRRGTVMAALQHGIAVLGTAGFLTDSLFFRGECLELVAADDEQGFAAAAVRLAMNQDHRRSLGEAGRRLYERTFDWPIVARRLVTYLTTEGWEGTSANVAVLDR
jgi:glycosyltransferase involved in cell wall biosynthesis